MIKEFRGEYKWLSNFATCEIDFNGTSFASVEHAYMSAKSNDLEWKSFCADANNSAGKVKKKSKKIVLREDWDLIKVETMHQLLKLKFSKEPYKTLLLDTGNRFIQEGNWWGDTFWGVDLNTNTGENNLGILIMAVRDTLLKEESSKKSHRIIPEITVAFFRQLQNAILKSILSFRNSNRN